MTTLDYAKRASTANLMQTMKAVARIHGKSPMAQRLEMFHLGRGFGRITPAEYYDFGLYRDADFSSEKHRFIGLRAQTQINAKCTNWRRGAVAVADDKILFHQVMRAEDLPVPRIVAIYHRDRRFRGAESCAMRATSSDICARKRSIPCLASPWAVSTASEPCAWTRTTAQTTW